MLLSPSQQRVFWREWSAACRAQHWTAKNGWTSASINAERHAMLARCGFDSLTQVDKTAGFDRVLAELRSLQADLDATQETDDPTIGQARRLRHIIRTELLPCLALYEPAPEQYLQTIIESLIRWHKTDRPTRPPTLDDLDAHPTHNRTRPTHALKEGPSTLEQCLMTLTARVDTKRHEAGHTLHDMRTQAGLKCTCAQCARAPIPAPAPDRELDDANAPW